MSGKYLSIRRCVRAIALLGCLIAIAPVSHAATLSVVGTLSAVDVDTTASPFSGTLPGAFAIASVPYGDTASDASHTFSDSVDETTYYFPGSYVGGFSLGGHFIPLVSIWVNIQNDHAITSDEASLAATILGVSASAGDLVDVWSLAGYSPGAFEIDLTPEDLSDEESLVGGSRVEFIFVSFDASLFSSTSYALAPPLGGAIHAGFIVDTADAFGVPTYSGYGLLAPVPIPAAFGLFGAALAVVMAARRGNENMRAQPGSGYKK